MMTSSFLTEPLTLLYRLKIVISNPRNASPLLTFNGTGSGKLAPWQRLLAHCCNPNSQEIIYLVYPSWVIEVGKKGENFDLLERVRPET